MKSRILTLILSLLAFIVACALAGCAVEVGPQADLPPVATPDPDAPVEAPTPVVRIVWADGATDYPGWCQGRVPTWFRCVEGEPCRPRILEGVRAWLAPFDVAVTDMEVSAPPLVTVLMSSGLAQECGRPEAMRGLAMIGAPAAGSWINIWSAGNDDAADAQVVAHELGHAIGGLQHVAQGSLMAPRTEPIALGYDDVDRWNDEGKTQNAYRAMLAVLGGAR